MSVTTRLRQEDVIAFLMDFESKILLSTLSPKIDVRYEVLEVKSPHHTVVFMEKKTEPLKNRTWLLSLVWKKILDAPPTYIWVAAPRDQHPKIAHADEAHAIRAVGTRCVRCVLDLDGTSTRLEYACALDMGGHLPQWLVESIAVPKLMRYGSTFDSPWTR